MSQEPEKIRVALLDRSISSWAGFIRRWLMIFSLLGIGTVVGNVPMQWVGFILLFAIVIYTFVDEKEKSVMTIDEARKRLDELEKKQ